MAGRPTVYDPEIATEICTRLSDGESLREICRSSDRYPPESTVREWARNDQNGFAAQYACARDIGMDCANDAMLEVARDESQDVQRSRLIVDTMKWRLSKMAPKRYGDRIEIAGDKDNPLEISIRGKELLTSRIDSLIARSRTDEPSTESD